MTMGIPSPKFSSSTVQSMDSSPESSHHPTEDAIIRKPPILPLQTKNNTCTGILLLKDQKRFFKLNYPSDKSIEDGGGGGGGHFMSELEVISECFHYQLLGELSFQDHELAAFQQSLKPVSLQRFSANSTALIDSYKAFDVKFPQFQKSNNNNTKNDEPLLVRARDMVRLVSNGDEGEGQTNNNMMMMMIVQEHFWAKVISVTTCGIVTAICVNDLTTTNLCKGDYIRFPMTCILGVVHGSYWEYKNSKDKDKTTMTTTKNKKVLFDENDVKLIEYQTGCSRGRAIEALLQSRGETVRACVGLLTEDDEYDY